MGLSVVDGEGCLAGEFKVCSMAPDMTRERCLVSSSSSDNPVTCNASLGGGNPGKRVRCVMP